MQPNNWADPTRSPDVLPRSVIFLGYVVYGSCSGRVWRPLLVDS